MYIFYFVTNMTKQQLAYTARIEKQGKIQNMHKAFVLMKKLDTPLGPQGITHDEKVALIWRLLSGMEGNRHDKKMKPFTWDMAVNEADSTVTLSFSSVVEEFTDVLLAEADRIMNEGKALQLGHGALWTVIGVFPVEDLPYIGRSIRLETVTGMVCKGRGKFLASKEAGWKEAVIRGLCRKAHEFLGAEIAPEEVSIPLVEHRGYPKVIYKGCRMSLEDVSLLLKGPRPILEVAIYNGLGSHTGSGFGAVSYH